MNTVDQLLKEALLVKADWLEEQDDPKLRKLAPGYRWAAEMRKIPYVLTGGGVRWYTYSREYDQVNSMDHIDLDIWRLIPCPDTPMPSLEDAYNNLALAYALYTEKQNVPGRSSEVNGSEAGGSGGDKGETYHNSF